MARNSIRRRRKDYMPSANFTGICLIDSTVDSCEGAHFLEIAKIKHNYASMSHFGQMTVQLTAGDFN